MSDFSDDGGLQDANISFVPQVGDGHKKKRGPKSRSSVGGAADNGAAPPPAGSYPTMPGFVTNENVYQQGMPPPPMAQPAYSAPPVPYPGQPHEMHYMSQQQQSPMMGAPVCTGQPVMMGGPPMKPGGNNNNMYPGQHHLMMDQQPPMMMMGPGGPQQPGAMVILVQDAGDLDYRAGLFEVRSCAGCANAYFFLYCLGARQQNMLRTTALEIGRQNDPAMLEQIASRVSSWNGCCSAAFVFDAARIALGFFFPQIFGSWTLVNGACLETFQTRQLIRSRFGIVPSQCQDCLVSLFCTPCAANQNQVEMERRGMDPHLCCGRNPPHPEARMQPPMMR